MKHTPVRQFYENGRYIKLSATYDGGSSVEDLVIVPSESGWGSEHTGALGRDHEGSDVIYPIEEVRDCMSAMGWHEDGLLLWVDLDYIKSDLTADNDRVQYPAIDRRPHIVSSKTEGNIQVPVIVEGLSDESAVKSHVDWIDVKGSASVNSPGYSNTLLNNDFYSYYWEEALPEGEWERADETVPTVQPGELEDIIALDGEPVLEVVDASGASGGRGYADYEGGSGDLYQLDRVNAEPNERIEHPWHGSSTGTNFNVTPGTDGERFACWRSSCARGNDGNGVHGGLVNALAMEYGLYECGDWYRLDGNELDEIHREARTRARADGYDLGDGVRSWVPDIEAVRELVSAEDGGRDENRQHLIRRQTEEWHKNWQDGGLEGAHNGVLTNYPNTGKSYGFHKVLAETGGKGTLLQPNHELRDEASEKAAEENALDVESLPSFPNDSPLMDEESMAYRQDVDEWYMRGMDPSSIYNVLDEDEIPEGDEYRRKMGSDLGERELLVGDPAHCFLERAIQGRHVAMDDIDPYSSFVDEYHLGDESVQASVRGWLEHHADELLNRGVDPTAMNWDEITNPGERTRDVLLWLADEHPAHKCIPKTKYVRASASRIVQSLMMTDRDDTRAQWVEPGKYGQGAGTKYTGARVDEHVIVAGLPLNLKHAESLLMMTATPVIPVFRKIFEDLDLSSGLYDSMDREQRRDYFDDVLGATVIQTTESSRFVSGGSNVRPDKFRTTVESIRDMHGEDPVIISSKKALGRLSDVTDDLGLETINFARAVGTTEFEDVETALVWGSPHYGDDYVRRVAAFCGDTEARPERDGHSPTTWSTEDSQRIYDNMTEGTVFQAMLRVGRSSDAEATIYVETDKIPDDVPRYRPEGRDLFHMFTAKEAEVLDAARELGSFTARDISDRVTAARRTVYDVLARLCGQGAVEQSGRGDYGADEFHLVLEAEGRGMLPESVSSDLKDIIMQKPHNLSRHDPEMKQAQRKLTDGPGADAADVAAEVPKMAQMGLDMFG